MHEVWIILGLILVSLLLFITEWIRYDVVALLVLVSLSLSGILALEEVFAGFSNPAVVTVAAVLVMSRAVQNSGLIEKLGARLIKWGKTPTRLMVMIMLSVALISGFINDIGAAALFMPLVIMVARRLEIPPSKLLIPLSFGCLLGGTLTLIGTPSNILVSLIMAEHGLEPFRMFDFTPVGAVILVAGIVYMTLLGQRLLPSRRGESSLVDRFKIRDYLTELVVSAQSPAVGRRLDQIRLESKIDFNILAIIRGRITLPALQHREPIREGDILLAEVSPDQLGTLTRELNLAIVTEAEPGERDLSSEEIEVVEAVVMPNSRLVGRNLRQLNLRRRYELTVMALSRQGKSVLRRLARVSFWEGDVLLIQGDRRRIDAALSTIGCLPLADREISLPQNARSFLSVGIFLGAVLLASASVLHVSMAFTLGALFMVLTGCISPRSLYEAIEWPILILMGGMIPLGTAMEKTGTATQVAGSLLDLVGSSDPYVILALLYLVVAALTSVLNNPSVAVIMTPIALDLSSKLEASPLPFLMITAVAASCAFLSPVSHKANVLVWGPGGYRFLDYTRVGLPLVLLIGLISVFLVPRLWPF